MPLMKKRAAVALIFAGMANAQSSSVISVFFPDTDPQTLVGSLIASVCARCSSVFCMTHADLFQQDASKTTVAFGCPSGTDPNECGFGTGQITATVGSSTLVATETL